MQFILPGDEILKEQNINGLLGYHNNNCVIVIQ